jgi:DNA-directed RNA polymerase specialized sigma24 family protein
MTQADSRDVHRPVDREALRAAAVEMARSGLTARDISQALGLTEAAVRQLLERAAA